MPESGERGRAQFEVRIAGTARGDIVAVLKRSKGEFGDAAARYAALIEQAVGDVGENPQRPRSEARPEMGTSVRTWHLEFSVKRMAGRKVRHPWHFIVYRVTGAQVEILRILHDERDLARHRP